MLRTFLQQVIDSIKFIDHRLLSMLILFDTVLIGIFIWCRWLTHRDILDKVPLVYDITREGSFAEAMIWTKWLAIAVFLTVLWWKRGAAVYLALAASFLLILADDALEIHERAGNWLSQSEHLRDVAGLRAQDLGELVVFGALGLTVLALMIAGFRFSPRNFWPTGFAFIGLLLALAVITLPMDMLGIAVANYHQDGKVWTGIVLLVTHVADDGGEMIVASVATALAWGLLRSAETAATLPVPAATPSPNRTRATAPMQGRVRQ